MNPKVSVVFDDHDKNDWSLMIGIRMLGTAELLWNGEEYRCAHEL